MENYYVILTGSRNNAGDFLIKYRAKQLFEIYRSDRKIIDYNAWEKFDDEKLKVVNNAKALILMGGPSLKENMRPRLYPMVDNLDLIKVPIIIMGIGWMSGQGDWENTYNFKFNEASTELIKRVENSGYLSSVRDYHTKNALVFNGFNNFLMTGCPAYYDLRYLNQTPVINKNIKKVGYSLGVSFLRSPSMYRQMKDSILAVRDLFGNDKLEVVFHHSLNRDVYLKVFGTSPHHVNMHNKFADWLTSNNIKYVDISGSAENLINYYENVDLHIGYRVHAHIFRSSISQPTILIAEDGRAKGTKDVTGGIVLNGYNKSYDSIISKGISKFFKSYDRFLHNEHLQKELISNIKYEELTSYSKVLSSRKQIDCNFEIMKQFLENLP